MRFSVPSVSKFESVVFHHGVNGDSREKIPSGEYKLFLPRSVVSDETDVRPEAAGFASNACAVVGRPT
jgi:hypothetical protein